MFFDQLVLDDAADMEVNYFGDIITTPVRGSNSGRPLARTMASFEVRFVHPVFGKDKVVVPSGFLSDWSSTPRFIWSIYPPHYGPARWGCWAHDWIYRREFGRIPKNVADDLLAACMLADGSSNFAAGIFRLATGVFGKGGWNLGQDT